MTKTRKWTVWVGFVDGKPYVEGYARPDDPIRSYPVFKSKQGVVMKYNFKDIRECELILKPAGREKKP